MNQGKWAAFLFVMLVIPRAWGGEAVGPMLSPHLKELLVQEMKMISGAMAEIMNDLVAGRHGAVDQKAAQIRDGFVINQPLTEEDRQVLQRLPKGFHALDRQFHQMAERLSQASYLKDQQLQRIFWARMLDLCVECHRAYAYDRFPGLTEQRVIPGAPSEKP